jgi:hypothetical protein
LSLVILPRWSRGWPLHLLRGVAFGALCGPGFIQKCDRYLVPDWWLWLAAGSQMLEDPGSALAATGPGFLIVGLSASLLSVLLEAKKRKSAK